MLNHTLIIKIIKEKLYNYLPPLDLLNLKQVCKKLYKSFNDVVVVSELGYLDFLEIKDYVLRAKILFIEYNYLSDFTNLSYVEKLVIHMNSVDIECLPTYLSHLEIEHNFEYKIGYSKIIKYRYIRINHTNANQVMPWTSTFCTGAGIHYFGEKIPDVINCIDTEYNIILKFGDLKLQMIEKKMYFQTGIVKRKLRSPQLNKVIVIYSKRPQSDFKKNEMILYKPMRWW